MEENQLKLKFSYTDEFGQTTEMNKSINTSILECCGELYFMVDQFKEFLLGAGFSQDLVNTIQILEEYEE